MRENVTFERSMTGSFMKILPEGEISQLDEKILTRNQIRGLLPVDRCILDGRQQYWYSITGCLSLDSYLSLHPLDTDLVLRLFCSLTEVVDRMEHYLLDANGLELSPEAIFLHGGSEMQFAMVPEAGKELLPGLRSLVEYLLTRVDHSNKAVVTLIYGLYEIVMEEGTTLVAMKEFVCRQTAEVHAPEPGNIALLEENGEDEEQETGETEEKADGILQSLIEKESRQDLFHYKLHQPDRKIKEEISGYKGFFSRIVQAFREEFVPDYDADMLTVIEPEEEIPVSRAVVNPTVCLAMDQIQADGLLVCESDAYENIHIQDGSKLIGSGDLSECRIAKDTVSAIHARVMKNASGYFLEDMNSTNGTYINGEILNYQEKRKLRKGDLIRFADVRYRFM